MRTAIIFWVFSSFLFTSAEAQLKMNSDRESDSLFYEKVYLHIDRNFFVAGEDIWFKAYITETHASGFSNLSNNLYVELISPLSQLIDRKTILVDNGKGFGDFHLNDSLPSGRYQLRAYTNYMRNFGELFFFQKEILVENHVGIKQQIISKICDNGVDIQFFPEGGNLILDVPAVVGFKALDSAGKGCKVKGWIVSSKGDTAAKFSDQNFGMGSFKFTSNRKLTYFAEGTTFNGIHFRTEMPQPLDKGYSMHIEDYDEKNLKITVKTNQKTLAETPTKKLIILGSSKKVVFITGEIIINSGFESALLPKIELPSGISCITLKDSSGIIFGERLIYLDKKENIKIHVSTDKKSYSPREKVELSVFVTDTFNNPISANLSLSVVNGSHIIENLNSTICSYLLLESEIKGKIEHPYSYFDTINHHRFQELNNLLLTQGWRNYVWNQFPDTISVNTYPVEKGFSFTGSLRQTFAKKPIANSRISLAIFDQQPVFKVTQTDENGRFLFDSIFFKGPQNLVISSTDKTDKSKGIIHLDEIKSNFPPVSYKGIAILTPSEVENTYEQEENIKTYREISRANYKTLKQYKITDTLMLDAVEVKARQKTMEEESELPTVFGNPDKVIDITASMLTYQNVFEILRYRINWKRMSSINNLKMYYDGVLLDPLTLSQISPFQFSRIEILYSGNIIAIYSRRGGQSKPLPLLSSLNKKMSGFYQARKFYSPRYDIPPDQYKPDLRTTVFWEPNFITDSEGVASCSFFNSDERSNIKINVEGFSESGLPLHAESKLDVN